ncbi:SpoIIAA-like protein [Litoreibacter ponti]|uniref:SpoIIAA-like protein n=1 Tax=Litoreibacter ponti TaxID=1510457 RepID=A0A2T6BH49_9RHOB|nr:STAS/SEC14 domain-containing protein [Litoreibacter ponti]PTX55380.1 SpoIIAA-like protein [Litoreibacter ponti]
MFTVEKAGAALIHVEIGGRITAEEMSQGLDTLLPMIAGMQDAAMRMVYHDVGLPELGAVMEEMKRLPQLFGALGHVKRVAVLSDAKWIRDMAELEGMVLPGTTIRGFPTGETASAEQFLSGEPLDDPMDDENFPV